MSQVPPPPPPQPPYGQPHADFAPPGAPLPGYGIGVQRRTSAAAVTSLVLGILGCVPFVTGLGAVIFGAVGIRRTRDPHVTGRGLAVAGLVLGLVSVVGWGLFGGALGVGYVRSRPARAVAEQFTKDLSTGNVAAAHALCTGNVARPVLDDVATRMKSWGPLQDMAAARFHYGVYGGVETCELNGSVAFANTRTTFMFRLVKQAGVFKVDGFAFADPNAAASLGPAPAGPSTTPASRGGEQ